MTGSAKQSRNAQAEIVWIASSLSLLAMTEASNHRSITLSAIANTPARKVVTKISSQQFLATTRADRFRRCYLRPQAETGNRNVGVSLFGHAAMHEAKLRHPHFFSHRDQDRRVFTDDDGSPLKGQRCPLIQQHLIHHVDRARVLKREMPLPVVV